MRSELDAATATVVERIAAIYREFRPVSRDELAACYSDDVVFTDPVQRIDGLDALTDYMNALAAGLVFCRFEFAEVAAGVHGGTPTVFIAWQMRFAHRALEGGRELAIPGASLLHVSGDRASFHRDFYDLGAMVYEHVPVLGAAVRMVRARLAH